jgi:hypothetical protein
LADWTAYFEHYARFTTKLHGTADGDVQAMVDAHNARTTPCSALSLQAEQHAEAVAVWCYFSPLKSQKNSLSFGQFSLKTQIVD